MSDAGQQQAYSAGVVDGASIQGLAQAAFAEAKPLLQSRTLWALLVTVVAYGVNKIGGHFSDAQTAQVIDIVTSLVQGGGVTAAAVFRVAASGPLK